MSKLEFDAGKALGSGIARMSRQELCQLVAKLCARIKAEAGTRSYRGGLYPDNIYMDAQGAVSVGLAKQSDWSGQELQFLPPELYWNGVKGSFSDVYSLGLLLYYGTSRGRLPFEGSCPDPQQRRMSGEDFPAPRAAGRRLGQIIKKATRFNSEERYKNVEELQIMLEGLGENQYLNGENGAEAIFKKSSGELSDLERIMVEIIENGVEEPLPEEEPEAEEAAVPEGEQAPAAPEEEEVLRVYEPQHKSSFSASAPAGAPRPAARQPIPILTEEKNPELAPVVPGSRPVTPAVQYGVSAKREKKIAEEVKKRRRRPGLLILVLCAILIVAALLINAMLRDFAWGSPSGKAPVPTGPVATLPPVSAALPSEAPDTAEDEAGSSTYEIVRADLSWTEARDRCASMGGHLAVISSEEEWIELIPLATERGIDHLWVGLYRDAGDLLTVTGEDEGSYLPWAEGEPSYTDGYDGAIEDYVMLSNDGTDWAYNDSRADPVADYPDIYGGSIGFICEYEGGTD